MDLSMLGLFNAIYRRLRGNMAISMDLRGTADKPMLVARRMLIAVTSSLWISIIHSLMFARRLVQ